MLFFEYYCLYFNFYGFAIAITSGFEFFWEIKLENINFFYTWLIVPINPLIPYDEYSV